MQVFRGRQIAWSNEHCPFDTPRNTSPGQAGGKQASETMGDQIGLAGLFKRAFQSQQPVVKVRMIPVVLNDATTAWLLL
ncbi:hypothetical protein RLEG3_01690 (plasmid) [Rhizobium leguminosarum bv. trifolii WSM1689]|nr:hypothetical protein RLEG3_01690 [Rhizobium leguminosarum bv. trifolii WSM1689]